ncbi:hypothetical protein [Elioraea sp.]|uniref:hypothetical protein n=1 Tax=Elioraea sp. TaxID=2185103 RepID=UPI0025BE5746|nr:hypothetical protein [Elioraea sp.]
MSAAKRRGAVLTVLGAGPVAQAARISAALAAGGDIITVRRAGDIAAFAVHGLSWRRDRGALRAMLARAAARSPFLPADPRTAGCDAGEWAGLIDASAPVLAAALSREGQFQQWDIATPPGAAGGPARIATLRAALSTDGLGFRVQARDGRLVLSVLLPAGSGPLVAVSVAASGSVGISGSVGTAGTPLTIEGPLPPLAFAAFRIEAAEHAAVSRAWAMLALKADADRGELARRWRTLAFALDPSGEGRPAARRPLAEAGRAVALLHGLAAGRSRFAREDLIACCGTRLALPAPRDAGAVAARLLVRA